MPHSSFKGVRFVGYCVFISVLFPSNSFGCGLFAEALFLFLVVLLNGNGSLLAEIS
jgi:hypothetical protein